MIYRRLPIKYKFLPITDAVFHIMFVEFYEIYLDAHANYLLELMDDDDVNDGARLRMAKDAKEIYKYKQQEEELLDCVCKVHLEYVKDAKKTIKSIKSIPLSNCQFNFYDYRYENFELSKLIWNSIKEEIGIVDDEEDDIDYDELNAVYIDEIIARDAMGGMEFYTMPNGTVGMR